MPEIRIKPWLRPAAYIATATLSCFLFTEFVPPLLDPALAARLPVVGGLPGDLPGYWTRFALSFLLLGLLPFLVMLACGDRPRDLGLNFRTPILRRWWFWLLVPAAIAGGAMGAASPDLGAYYPYSHDLVGRVRESGLGPLLGHYAAYIFLYYAPWEFFFRGFLLLGLLSMVSKAAGRAGLGGGAAAPDGGAAVNTLPGLAPRDAREAEVQVLAIILVLFQTMPSTMLHVGHPLSELGSAVVAGLVFGVLAWKTRSIVPGFIIHAALGVGTDGFIVLKGAGLL